MKIGNIELGERPLFLAPMEDVTDPAFRLMCKEFGSDLAYTEFVSSDALVRSVQRTEAKLQLLDQERPVAIQIYGKDPQTMAQAAIRSAQAEPNIIDLNFGCPVKKVAGKGAGAGLLRDIDRMLEITKCVVEAVSIPVTVKTRLGWDDGSRIIVELAEQLQECGIAALTIHGRTRAQMYTGQADWSLIKQVKENPRMHIPIIGNGDITTPQGALWGFEQMGVDAVMIGRGAIGRPWIFREIRHYLDTGGLLPPISLEQGSELLKQMTLRNVEKLDERRGISHIRRHLAATPIYKGIPNFRPTRIAMLRANTLSELFGIMDSVVQSEG